MINWRKKSSGDAREDSGSRHSSPATSAPNSPQLPSVEAAAAAAVAALEEEDRRRPSELRDRFSDSDMHRIKRRMRPSAEDVLAGFSSRLDSSIPRRRTAAPSQQSQQSQHPAVLKREQTQFFVPGMSQRTPNNSSRNLLRAGSFGSLQAKQSSDRKKDRDLAQLRLLRRDAPFHQSGGHMYMHRRGGVGILLALQDYFHVALSMPIVLLFTGCITLYTLIVLLWAGIYSFADHPGVQCGIAPLGERPQFYHAFIFSLETMTTIGYDIPHAEGEGGNGGNFFQPGCTSVFIAVYAQAMLFIITNAIIVGVLFGRVGTATSRSSQIVFSNKAVVRCVRHRFYFMFQVAETSYFSYNPVVEAHVRVYAILHEEIRLVHESGARPKEGGGAGAPGAGKAKGDGGAGGGGASPEPPRRRSSLGAGIELKRACTTALGGLGGGGLDVPRGLERRRRGSSQQLDAPPEFERAYFQTRVMRLTNPNDELGGMMFLATPQVVSHRIDRWSPLFPPAARTDDPNDHDGNAYHFPGLIFREADRDVATSDAHADRGHERFARIGSQSMRRAGSGAIEFAATGAGATRGQLRRMQELIRQHLQRSKLEVIIMVEAMDPHSGNNFQARHSYTAEDIEFDKSFAACMDVDPTTGMAHLDWSKFHEVHKVPFDASQIVGGSHS